jgi:two-component system, OmpR family, sensor histidine kinase KdpD
MDPAMTSGARPGLADRPDLIAQAAAADKESLAGRGRLRTYLGIAPGVGKTYAMLRDGRARWRSGVDAVVAYREGHGRAATAAQLADLEVLPTRTVTYRGASFAELDVAAVLDRRPGLVLVDELAHANLPGEPRAKRWHDVGELLANGIDVYTTLNVANIESLGALVSRITGVHPAEPVPDAFVRAGEIKLVDLAPAALRRRLTQGLVVPEDRVDAALSSYFRFANLAALRELARLWLDDSAADPVTAFLAARGVSEPVRASVIVVGLAGSPADEWLIRYAARLAGLSDARLQGVHVRDIDNLGRSAGARLEQDRQLLGELGGNLAEVKAGDTASGLVQAARQAGACQLVIGSRRRSRWSRLLTGSTVADQVLRAAGDLPVQVVNVGRPDTTSDQWRTTGHDARQPRANVSGPASAGR